MQLTKKQIFEPVASLFISTLLLSGMAFYNGYPLVFFDTSFYIGWKGLSYRSIFYNYFISPSLLFHSLWPIVFIQSLIVAYLLRLVLRVVFDITSWYLFLLLTLLLCLLTTLTSFTGFIMPDIFTGVLILSLYLLVFCRDSLVSWEKGCLFIITFIAAIVHLSHIPLAIVILTFTLLFRFFVKKKHLPIPRLAGVFATILIALLIMMSNNYRMWGTFTMSPGGYAFILARLIVDGPATKYLREHCSEHNYALCDFLDELPPKSTDYFLWNRNSPFHKVGHINGYRQEGKEIVRETILHYPFQIIKTSIYNGFRQLFMIKNSGWRPDFRHPYPTMAIGEYFPEEFRYYANSLQSRKLLPLETLDYLYTGVCLLSLLIAVAALIIFKKFVFPQPLMFFIFITYTYFIHAFLTGALSLPDDRFGSRTIWLLPLFSLASAMHITKNWKHFNWTMSQSSENGKEDQAYKRTAPRRITKKGTRKKKA
jgi:hypothetical protein